MCIRDRQEGTAIAGENIPFSNIDQLVGAGVTVDSVDSYGIGFLTVSYTHLDVYKRQSVNFLPASAAGLKRNRFQ